MWSDVHSAAFTTQKSIVKEAACAEDAPSVRSPLTAIATTGCFMLPFPFGFEFGTCRLACRRSLMKGASRPPERRRLHLVSCQRLTESVRCEFALTANKNQPRP